MWIGGTESQTLLKRLGTFDDMAVKITFLASDDAYLYHTQNICNSRGFAIKVLIIKNTMFCEHLLFNYHWFELPIKGLSHGWGDTCFSCW